MAICLNGHMRFANLPSQHPHFRRHIIYPAIVTSQAYNKMYNSSIHLGIVVLLSLVLCPIDPLDHIVFQRILWRGFKGKHGFIGDKKINTWKNRFEMRKLWCFFFSDVIFFVVKNDELKDCAHIFLFFVFHAKTFLIIFLLAFS